MTKKENRIIWPDIRSVEYLTSCPDAWISGECIVVATPPLIRKLAFFHVPSFNLLPLSLLHRHSIPTLLPPSHLPTVGHSPFFFFSFFLSRPFPPLSSPRTPALLNSRHESRKERTCSPRSIDKYYGAVAWNSMAWRRVSRSGRSHGKFHGR